MSIPFCKIKDKLIKQWVPAILVPTPGKINVTFFYANRYSQKQGFESVSGSNICSPPPKPIYNNYKSEITLSWGLWSSNRGISSECVMRYQSLFCAHIYIFFTINLFCIPSSRHRCKQLKKKQILKHVYFIFVLYCNKKFINNAQFWMYMKFSSDWEAVPKFVNVAEIFWNSLGKQIWKMKNNFKILCPVPVAG